MNRFWRHLRQSKLVQWALAYTAGTFAALQGVDIVAERFAWPGIIERVLIILILIGFFVTLLLAWYHGERGAQRVSGPELLLMTLLLVIGGGVLWIYGRPPAHPAATAASPTASVAVPGSIPAKSIAVLPFENLSEEKNNGYFADGMQDLILTKLADIGELKVISRTSTLQYGSHPKNLKQIGRELGVAVLLEGSVQKSGDQVLINVQLIDARTDVHLWADSYQRTLTNVFGVEGEVAGRIANALKAKLTPGETKRLATSLSNVPQANDLFLRAESLVLKSSTNSTLAMSLWKRAIPLYKQSLEFAPDFALAHARLSGTESQLANFGGGGMDVRKLLEDAHMHAEMAMKLAPDLADAYAAMGTYVAFSSSDYDAAIKYFLQGIKLRPSDAFLHVRLSGALASKGKYDEALLAARRAWELDPRSFYENYNLARAYMLTGRYDRAEQYFKQALALSPDSAHGQAWYAKCIVLNTGDVGRALKILTSDGVEAKSLKVTYLSYQRDFDTAIAIAKSVPQQPGIYYAGDKDIWLGDLYRWAGDITHAREHYAKALTALHQRLPSQFYEDDIAWTWFEIADAELGLGRKDAGIAAIKTAQATDAKGVLMHLRSARVYATAHKEDLATSQIDRALNSSGIGNFYSPTLLWIDPWWDPIRKTPAFQALLKKYAKYRPASLPADAKA